MIDIQYHITRLYNKIPVMGLKDSCHPCWLPQCHCVKGHNRIGWPWHRWKNVRLQ